MAQPMDPQQVDPPVCFEDFYRREYRMLLKMVMLLGGRLDDAHDAVNQTMAELISRWKKIDHPRAYVRRAVVTNFIKQQQRDRQGPLKAAEGGYLVPEAQDCPELTAWEDKQWIDQLVCSLPPAQREVVEALLDGVPIEEIAAQLGHTPATIRQRLSRARRRLVRLRKQQSRGNDGGEIR